MSDNYHQPVMGGTGPNSVPLGFADQVFFGDGAGNVATPPASTVYNPNPQVADYPANFNLYTSRTQWFNCSDPAQPGIQPILDYLREAALRGVAQLPAGRLLQRRQRQSGVDAARHAADRRDRTRHPGRHPAQHRRRAQRQEHPVEVLRRRLQRLRRREQSVQRHLLQHLQSVRVPGQLSGHARRPHARRDRPVRRPQERHAAGGVLGQARRGDGRPSGELEVQPVRGVRRQHHQARPGQQGGMGRDRDLRHGRRGRRLLRLRASSSRSTSSAPARASR